MEFVSFFCTSKKMKTNLEINFHNPEEDKELKFGKIIEIEIKLKLVCLHLLE